MGVKQWIQGLLPVFGETILPGDFVKVRHLLSPDGCDIYDVDKTAGEYVGQVGQVLSLTPDWPHPVEVQFKDGAVFSYSEDELERQA